MLMPVLSSRRCNPAVVGCAHRHRKIPLAPANGTEVGHQSRPASLSRLCVIEDATVGTADEGAETPGSDRVLRRHAEAFNQRLLWDHCRRCYAHHMRAGCLRLHCQRAEIRVACRNMLERLLAQCYFQ
jgi:hypothetical protein